MLARVAPLAFRAIPREIFRSCYGTRILTPKVSFLGPTKFTLTRHYATEKTEQSQTNEKEQKQQEQTGEQKEQKEQEKKQGGGSGALVLGGLLALGATAIYFIGLPTPLQNFWNDNVYVQLQNFAVTFRNNIYHLFGISTEEMPFLPPPLPDGYGRKYTIVLDMDALADTIQTNGAWRIHKRAGLDYFLATLVRNYEIVLYTKEYQGTNQNAIFKLDPAGVLFQHQKFRDSGVKNSSMEFTDQLARFQRDPSRIIFIDSTASDKAYGNQNVLCVGKPKLGEQADTVLIDLTKILHGFAVHNGNDVRTIVQDLQGPDISAKIRELINRGNKQPQQQQQQQPQQPQQGKRWFGR